MDREEVAHHIVDSAVAMHTALGPGLLESVYRRCLIYELRLSGLDVYAEYPIPIRYKEVVLDCGYRADLLVDKCILVENKTVDAIHPIHRAQLLTCLKQSGHSIGFLLNPHFSQDFYCGGVTECVCCVTLPRTPRRT